jgi:hypothetical protein
MVNEALVNAIPPNVPVPVPVKEYVIGSALVCTTPSRLRTPISPTLRRMRIETFIMTFNRRRTKAIHCARQLFHKNGYKLYGTEQWFGKVI